MVTITAALGSAEWPTAVLGGMGVSDSLSAGRRAVQHRIPVSLTAATSTFSRNEAVGGFDQAAFRRRGDWRLRGQQRHPPGCGAARAALRPGSGQGGIDGLAGAAQGGGVFNGAGGSFKSTVSVIFSTNEATGGTRRCRRRRAGLESARTAEQVVIRGGGGAPFSGVGGAGGLGGIWRRS